jgi:hypothetical protein
MKLPEQFDPKAEQLLMEGGYRWDDWHYGFRRVRRRESESTDQYLARGPIVITFEELDDHGLLRRPGKTGTGRRKALEWLEQRIKSLD